MPFRKGQSGNPGGRSREKPIADAIRAVVNEVDPKTQRRKVQLIAEKLVEHAMNGEGWAIQQVADRLDGKPAQEATLTHQRKRVSEMTDDEIAERIAFLDEECKRVAEAEEDDGSPKPH